MKINNEEPLLKIVDTYTSYETHDYKKSNSRKDVQFCCDQCDYKATQKVHLKRHIDSVHGYDGTKLSILFLFRLLRS